MIFYNMENFLEFINEKSRFVKIPETLNLEYLEYLNYKLSDELPTDLLKNNLELYVGIFEKKGIYVNVTVVKDDLLKYVRGYDSEIIFPNNGELKTINSDVLKSDIYDTREEATLKALIKAKEIYNAYFVRSNKTDG